MLEEDKVIENEHLIQKLILLSKIGTENSLNPQETQGQTTLAMPI